MATELGAGNPHEYHPTSAHWVLAELISEVTVEPYTDEIHRRVTDPLGHLDPRT